MLDTNSLNVLFNEAKTYYGWQQKPVSPELLHQIYNLTKMGPTSVNCCPLRVVFVQTPVARAKLKPCLAPANVDKTMSAPVTAILGYDLDFHDHLPKLYPHTDARAWFTGNQDLINTTAVRNGTLQAGFFLMAARACGLDCGPMSGFDNAMVDEAFFAGTNIKSNFLCNLGYGDTEHTYPRAPRFEFGDVCSII